MPSKFYALPDYEDDAHSSVDPPDKALEEEVKASVIRLLAGKKLAERDLLHAVVHEINHAKKPVGERRVSGGTVRMVLAGMVSSEDLKIGKEFLPAVAEPVEPKAVEPK